MLAVAFRDRAASCHVLTALQSELMLAVAFSETFSLGKLYQRRQLSNEYRYYKRYALSTLSTV
jgi:hypothetical protein